MSTVCVDVFVDRHINASGCEYSVCRCVCGQEYECQYMRVQCVDVFVSRHMNASICEYSVCRCVCGQAYECQCMRVQCVSMCLWAGI